MNRITTRLMRKEDIQTWLSLSHEYDDYVRELVPDLTQWYEGNKTDIAFTDYMKIKIEQCEAYMATEKNTQKCLGVVAFSRKHNRITFFGISHTEDFYLVGEKLISLSLNQLDSRMQISINVLRSKAQHIGKERELIKKFGFTYNNSELENGVPVDKMIKQPS